MSYINGFCGDCGEEFRYDDVGGYNPPCPCGCGSCRSCHDADAREELEWTDAADEDDWQDYERNPGSAPGASGSAPGGST